MNGCCVTLNCFLSLWAAWIAWREQLLWRPTIFYSQIQSMPRNTYLFGPLAVILSLTVNSKRATHLCSAFGSVFSGRIKPAIRWPVANPKIQRLCGNPDFFCPLIMIQCHAIQCKPAVSMPIVCLLLGSCPHAVIFRVWAIIVKALNRCSRRTISHISAERCKILPFIADINSATAIPWIVKSLRILTTTEHAFPDVIVPMGFHPPILHLI